ncbi:hypothetical protein N7510_011794 [Penicillium lagena]|uniref:uncharacterized protein n=1 Tax=Penicillium lagena TaxID=94218 RepID=UPI002540D7E8|nr:uncharacterized protein N7510_011794 [Penicillium lagena]KAJ5602260.1 hypothetical protein N7510_011794 [Penicillium lagena]
MPGVPSSRGCDACRLQKKKCDQLRPACSRCVRLNIACVGGGQQRYMFKVHTMTSMATRTQSAMSVVGHPARPPGNESVTAIRAFVSVLEITDLRYDLSTYGTFLRDIPQRLGSNPALDAAVDALTCAFPFLKTRDYPPNVLTRYNHSLRALRSCLDDPVQAQTSNTLCAIYLIVICQAWLGLYHKYPNHGEAMAHILRAAALREWQSTFDADLVTTLCIPVIFESITNPNIKLDARFWEQAAVFSRRSTVNNIGDSPKPTTKLCQMGRISEFMRFPDIHHHEIAATYQLLRNDAYRMINHLIQRRAGMDLSTSSATVIAYARYQAACCLIISLSLILNCLLRAFDATNSLLCEEASAFCDEIITIAESVSCHRPLGSGYAAVCLVPAWAATDDPQQLARIETIMAEYQLDFIDFNWSDRATWLRSSFDTLRQGVAKGDRRRGFDPGKYGTGNEACVIL